MRRAVTAACGLTLGFMLVPAGSAAVPSATQTEIEHLLTAVGNSVNGWLLDELRRYRQRAATVGRSASRELVARSGTE